MEFLSNVIYVFTDGGIKGQNGKQEDKIKTIGVHSFILLLNGKEYSHVETQRDSTSNREEMLGILHGLQKLNRRDLPVKVTSDSQYCVKGLTMWLSMWKKNGWKTAADKPVKNRDIWESLDEIVSEFEDIEFIWTKGHNDNEYNERCDKLCQQGIKDFEAKLNLDK